MIFRSIRSSLKTKLGGSLCLLAVSLALLGVWISGRPPTLREGFAIGAAALGALAGSFMAIRFLVLAPLEALERAMNKARDGNFLIRAQVRSDDEIGRLAGAFNTMLARVTDLAATQIDSEREKELIQQELKQKQTIADLSEDRAMRIRELTLLQDVTSTLASSLDLDEVLKEITGMVGDRLGFDEFSVLLYEPDSREYVVSQTFGMAKEIRERLLDLRFSADEGLMSVVHESRNTLYVPDTKREPRYLHYKGRRTDDGSVLLIPMFYRETPVGALVFNRPRQGAFDAADIGVLETVAKQSAMAIANARLYEKTLELSITDPLTGLFNRRQLERRLDMEVRRSVRFHQPMSAVMIDIDHFKNYNDSNGHPAGDLVLMEVAQCLLSSVRSVDTVARYGGEEFTLILPRSDALRGLEVADKVRAAVEGRRFQHEENQPGGRLTLSLGLASYPAHAKDAESLLQCADIALYHAKDKGRNRSVGYEPGMVGPKA